MYRAMLAYSNSILIIKDKLIIITDRSSRIVETPTGITNVESGHSHKAIKTIENGRVVIIRDGVRYDITGRKL